MSLARKVGPPPVPSGRTHARRREARSALVELQRLVRVLERHAPLGDAVVRRDLALLGDDCWIGRAEPHLRAVSALLVTIASYQQLRGAWFRETRGGPASPDKKLRGAPATVPSPQEVANGVQRDAATTKASRAAPAMNGTPATASSTPAAGDRELAAAAARYIARDLAARQLSEFTSAEGYRLARALARLGRVETPVEQLLKEANQVRLHPMPLVDAFSHSAH